jgi:hypothetical protein
MSVPEVRAVERPSFSPSGKLEFRRESGSGKHVRNLRALLS